MTKASVAKAELQGRVLGFLLIAPCNQSFTRLGVSLGLNPVGRISGIVGALRALVKSGSVSATRRGREPIHYKARRKCDCVVHKGATS